MTNALSVHRMGLRDGDRATAPAAYVRALDLTVERPEQTNLRTANEDTTRATATPLPPSSSCRVEYDEAGLVLDYPRIALRAG